MKNILLIGLGRFGRHIAEELNRLDHRIMAVDMDENRVNAVLGFVTNAQIGDSTDKLFLSSLGVDNYDAAIVAIGDDFQSSLETTSLLKELGARHVISRAATEVHEKFLLRNGADEVIYPEKELAKWTAVKCTSDHILDFIPIDGDLSILEITVPEHWCGKSVIALDIRKKYGVNILGIRRNGNIELNFDPSTVMTDDMSLYVAGDMRSIKKCLHF